MSVEELAKKRIIPLVGKIDPNYHEAEDCSYIMKAWRS